MRTLNHKEARIAGLILLLITTAGVLTMALSPSSRQETGNGIIIRDSATRNQLI